MGHKVKQSLMSSRIDFFYYAFRNVLLVSLPVLVVSALTLSSFHSSAMNSSADSVRINLPTSCTLSGNVTAEHAASMVSGQRKEDIGTTEINTICNDKNGYVVYAMGTTKNQAGEVVLSSIIGSDYDIKTGDASSDNTHSSWAMKLNVVPSDYAPTLIDTYNDKYVPVPSNWTKVAFKESGTSTNPESTTKSAFTTTYAVYTTPGQPAGTYSGQVEYVMLHPSTAAEPTDTLEHAFALAGKSRVQVTDPITGQSGSFYKMQDMTTNICESTTLVDEQNTLQLVDIRDNKLYWVTKLRDGHCWMTQNLDLDLGVKDTALGIDTTVLTSEDTDLNDNSLMGAYKDGYVYENGVLHWVPRNITYNYQSKTGTSWQNNVNIAYSLDPGTWYWNTNDNTPNCNYLTTTCEDFAQTPYSNNGTHGSVGNYYNWSAAIASDDSSSLTESTYNNINDNPRNSICPKGWRLPTISNQQSDTVGSTSEFNNLNMLYNAANLKSDTGIISRPLNFVRSGVFGGRIDSAGARGFFWSSSAMNNVYAYYLDLSKNNIDPSAYYYNYYIGFMSRNDGRSVRCVAR